MTSALKPPLRQPRPVEPAHGAAIAQDPVFGKEETRDYLADMLKELSAIAGWAGLAIAQEHIDAARHEVEAAKARG